LTSPLDRCIKEVRAIYSAKNKKGALKAYGKWGEKHLKEFTQNDLHYQESTQIGGLRL
jgi:hypothetical protein